MSMATTDHLKPWDDDEAFAAALQLSYMPVLPVALKTTIELGVLEIISNAGPGVHLSSHEIVSRLPTHGTDASAVLERILRLLASFSILECLPLTDESGRVERRYGLGPVCRYLVKNEDGVSLAPLVLLLQERVFTESWFHLKDAVLEGAILFEKAHGMNTYEYAKQNHEFHMAHSKGMSDPTVILMKKILDTYKGFEGLKGLLVNVGGGEGTSISMIVSKYPHIKGINFDFPHVVADAPTYAGVEHVGGDMFERVPSGEAIFMKWILPAMTDDESVRALKNCCDALPESGKLILVDSIAPEIPETNVAATSTFLLDLIMLMHDPDAKQRTRKEFEELAKKAGFSSLEVVSCVCSYTLMELYKNM